MSIFTGAGVAIVTPMKANGEINYDKLAELLDYQINNSTDAIVICGTTGESATMTESSVNSVDSVGGSTQQEVQSVGSPSMRESLLEIIILVAFPSAAFANASKLFN